MTTAGREGSRELRPIDSEGRQRLRPPATPGQAVEPREHCSAGIPESQFGQRVGQIVGDRHDPPGTRPDFRLVAGKPATLHRGPPRRHADQPRDPAMFLCPAELRQVVVDGRGPLIVPKDQGRQGMPVGPQEHERVRLG
jgi:hypothetical protein